MTFIQPEKEVADETNRTLQNPKSMSWTSLDNDHFPDPPYSRQMDSFWHLP
jgi:hypothetical protein